MWRKSLVNTLIQIGGKGITLGSSLIITAWLTRKLGVEGYGNYALILSMVLLLDSLADWGTGVIGVREASREEDFESEIYGCLLWLRMGLSGVAVLAGLGLMILYPGLASLKAEFAVALGMVVVGSWLGGVGIIFQTRLKWGWKTACEILYPVSFMVMIVTSRGPLTLLLTMKLYVIARVLALIAAVMIVVVMEKIDWKKMLIVRGWRIKKLWLAAWPMGLYLMIFATYDRGVDLMMINSWRGSAEVAWYGLAYKIFANLTMPAFFLVSSIFPLLVKTGADRIYKLAKIWLSVGAILLVLVVWVTAPAMVAIIAGGRFEPAVGVLRVLALALPFSYLNHLYGFDLISREGQGQMLKWGLVSLVINVGLNSLFITNYGMMAAAVVTVITEMSMWVMLSRSKRI